MVALLIILMVSVGGYVRLSRAGLSIVQWDVVTGVVPPIGGEAWERSFSEYRQTPEYQLVNSGMSLAAYQRIFYIEWAHRLIARIAGLLVVIPLIWFLWKRRLSFRESLRYWAIAALFGLQGAIGWVMVSSGLQDRPTVSHFRLTIHLLTALALLGIVLWMALGRLEAERPTGIRHGARPSNSIRILAWVLLGAVVLQIAYGGLVAGLKAGYVSNTWPLMFGRVIPEGLLTASEPWWVNLYEPLGSHWVHRWFAFVVAALAVAVFGLIHRHAVAGDVLRTTSQWLIGLVTLQITLGVGVIVWGVPKWIALAHQSIGVALFCAALVTAYIVWSRTRVGVDQLTPQPQ